MKVPCFCLLGLLILFERLLTQPVYESDIVIIPIVRIKNKAIVELALRDLLEDCTPRRISVKPKYSQKCDKLKQCIDRTMDAADEIDEDESSALFIDPRALRFLKQPLTLIVITEKVEYYPELANYSVKYIVVGGNNTDSADFRISSDTLVIQDADQLEEIESFCTQFPKKRIQDEGTPLDLRIHLGFGNITEDGLRDVKYLISTLVTDSRMDRNAGMIHIRGPRERTLAVCSWHSYCDLSTFHLEDVKVPLTAIGTEDMDYAPDVLQFLNREYRRKREKKKVYLLLLQDFISPSFLNQGFAFENAEKKQDLSVGMGIFLNENGVTDAIEKDYYGAIDYIDVYPADEVSDLFLLMNDILSTIGPEGPTVDPSEATESPTKENQTTTTVSPAHLNSHTMIIVVSFSSWTSVEDFDKMKVFIYERSQICLPENENIAVWDGRTMTRNPLCTNIPCVEAQVTSLSYLSPLSPPLDLSNLLTELLLSAATDLKPNPSSKILPKLVLFTNYEPVSFLKSYEDANGVLRKKLSTVDFQVVLVNKTDAFHNKLSVSNSHIHQFDTVDDMLNDNQNPFCEQNFAVDPPAAPPASSSSHITTIIIAFAALLLIILLVILYRMLIYIKALLRKTDLKEISSNDKKCLVDSGIGLEHFSECKNLDVKDLSVFGKMAEDPWEMSRQQIIQGEEVGRGNSSVVYRGSLLGRAPCEFIYRKYFFAYQFDNVPVAIKMQVPPSSDISRRQLLDEIEILKSIPPHMNIANMLGCDTSINPVCIVVELANEGNIKEFLKGKHIENTSKSECNHDLPNTVCRHDLISFLWQICDGLAFIHASGVLHRDVAARNILVQKDRNVLISDFGLAIWKEEGKRNKGTEYLPIKWMSPESLSKGIFTPETDVWSFGICAWEILSGGEEPFSQVPTQEFLAYLNAGKRLHCPEACSPELWSILSECWNEDPIKRPNISSVGNAIGRILNEISTNYGYLDLTAVQHQSY